MNIPRQAFDGAPRCLTGRESPTLGEPFDDETGDSDRAARSASARASGSDASKVVPSDASGDGYLIRSDDNGFTVTLGGVEGSPPTTYDYTWTEFGITPDQVPYLTGEIPASRTWSASWDGTPTMSETAVPTGPTLASPEGFVRWNDNTWYSPDGLTWTASPLPDPTGTVQNVYPVDGGFVAFVVDQDGCPPA